MGINTLISMQRQLPQRMMVSMDRFIQLEAFVAAANLGSFSEAARAEGVSPTLIGRRIDALEARLGVRLFTRSTRRLSLTAEGQTLLEDVPALLDALRETESRISQSSAAPAGLLRLTAPAGFGRRHVAPLLPGLKARHPGLSFSLDLSDHFVDLVAQRVDCAIRIGELSDSSLVGIRLADNQRVVVASPQYLSRNGTPRSPHDLKHHECLSLAAHSGQNRGWLFRIDSQTQAVRIQGALSCSDGSVLHTWCLGGYGLAWRSLWEVHQDIQAGRLVTVLDEFKAAPSGIFALIPERRLAPPKVRALIDWLKYHYQQPDYWHTSHFDRV